MVWKITTAFLGLLLIAVAVIAMLWREQAITLAANMKIHCESGRVGQMAVLMKFNDKLVCVRGGYTEKG